MPFAYGNYLDSTATVIACWLLDESTRYKILETDYDDFEPNSIDRYLFSLIRKKYLENPNFDLADILYSVKDDEIRRYIVNITTDLITTAFFEVAFDDFKREAQQRKAREYLKKIVSDENTEIDIAETIKKLSEFSVNYKTDRGTSTEPRELAIELYEYLEEAYKLKGKLPGIPTGFSRLDVVIGGIVDDMYIVLGGRPAMGKSAFAINLAWNIVKNGYAVLYASCEMSKKQIMFRILARQLQYRLDNIRFGVLSDEHWSKIAKQIIPFISQSKLHIMEGVTNIEPIFKEALRLRAKYGQIGVVIIDYVQSLDIQRGYNLSSYEKVSLISKTIRDFVKSEHIPVIAVAQLNRDCETREDKRPVNSDLRDSGQIEQDADVIMFLHRPAYYDPDFEDKSLTELIITKNREGETGILEFTWHPQYQAFVERETLTNKETTKNKSKKS